MRRGLRWRPAGAGGAAKRADDPSEARPSAANGSPSSRSQGFAALALFLAIGGAILLLFGSRDRAGFSEEAVPFRQALTLWGWGDSPPTANPHFFSYPSLSIYWHWLVQWVAALVGVATGRYGAPADAGVEFALAPQYLVLAGRASLVACTVLAAWIAYRWSRSTSTFLATLAGLGVCLSPPLIRSVIQMSPEAMMGWLGLLALLELRRVREGRGGRAMTVGIFAGLLCGTKYSGLPFLLFCTFAMVIGSKPDRGGMDKVWKLLLAAMVVFLVTTPFALLAPAEFVRDVGFELDHLARGHLGGSHASTAIAHAGQLWRGLGPGFPIALAGYLLLRTVRPSGAGLLLVGACAYVVPACLSSSGGPERYIVPAFPMLVLFMWEVTWAALRARLFQLRALGVLLAVLGIGQIASTIRAISRSTGPSPAACASEWLRANTLPEDIVVQDHGSTTVFTVDDREALLRSSCLRQASAPWQARAMSVVPRSVVTVPFVAEGRLYSDVEAGDGRRVRVVLFDPAWKLVPVMYSAPQDVGVQFFVRSSGIEDRLAAALGPSSGGDRWPTVPGRPLQSCRAAGGGLFGDAEVAVYTGASGVLHAGALGRGWWLRDAEPPSPLPDPADSVAYAKAAEQLYDERVRPFLVGLAQGALRRGDTEALARAARLLLVSNRRDVLAVRFALIGLESSRADSVWDATGRTPIRKAAGETGEEWRRRVLRAWGVDEPVANAESERFEAWRRSTNARSDRSPGDETLVLRPDSRGSGTGTPRLAAALVRAA